MEVFTDYYASLTSILPIRNITSRLINERVISFEDEEEIKKISESEGSSLVLRKVASSLRAGQTKSFDLLLSIMEEVGNVSCKELVNQMRKELGISLNLPAGTYG